MINMCGDPLPDATARSRRQLRQMLDLQPPIDLPGLADRLRGRPLTDRERTLRRLDLLAGYGAVTFNHLDRLDPDARADRVSATARRLVSERGATEADADLWREARNRPDRNPR